MSRLHLLILWVLALVAGVIVFTLKGQKNRAAQNDTDLNQGDTVFEASELRESTGLVYLNGENTSTIKLAENSWIVAEEGDYPATLGSLSRAFDAVRKLKIVQGLPATAEHWARFGLDESAEDPADRPRVLTVLGPDGAPTRSVYIGKPSESTGGNGGTEARFVRFSDDPTGVYIVEEGFDSLPTSSVGWIDKKLPKVEAPLRIEMKPHNELVQPWTVSRKTAGDNFQLEGLRDDLETEITGTAPLRNLMETSTFIELLSEKEVEKRAAKEDARDVIIETASGITYAFHIVPEKKAEPEKKDDKKDDKEEKTDNRNYIVSFKLTSGPKDPVKPGEDATEAQKAGYQALVKNKRLEEQKFAQQKALEGRHFLVSNFVVAPLLKPISKLQKMKAPPAPAKPAGTTPAPVAPKPNVQGAPSIMTPGKPPEGANKPRKRIEAVTPPIAIPRAPKAEEKEEE
ncbi:MAG: DUF4340 domain-containing protein [Verrucomicrobiaceae bacterium]